MISCVFHVRLRVCKPSWKSSIHGLIQLIEIKESEIVNQREKLGTLGRVSDIYTNIYHLYMYIYGFYIRIKYIYWLYRAI